MKRASYPPQSEHRIGAKNLPAGRPRDGKRKLPRSPINEPNEMTYGIDIFLRCRLCETKFNHQVPMSCLHSGTRRYTDGYVHRVMAEEQYALLRCPGCHTVQWLDQFVREESAMEDDRVHWGDCFKRHAGAPECLELPTDFGWPDDLNSVIRAKKRITLTISDFPALLEARIWRNRDEEKYVRIRAWWATNHQQRSGDVIESEAGETVLANLEELLEILDEAIPEELLMKAEALRQMRRFDECIQKISGVNQDESSILANSIRHLAEARNSRVHVLPTPESQVLA